MTVRSRSSHSQAWTRNCTCARENHSRMHCPGSVGSGVSTVVTDCLPLLNCAVACEPRAGESASADLYLVRQTDRGALLAVMDGAGHGADAIEVAQRAAAVVSEHASEGVIALIRLCHERLLGTRGAVISLISVDGIESTITWVGVGNVVGVLLRPDVIGPKACASIPLQPGVVGYRLPPLQASVTPIMPGDLLILATDGIRRDFVHAFSLDDEPGSIAEYISSNFPRGDDSRLVLVARYLGQNQ